jgi:hypothetical protein
MKKILITLLCCLALVGCQPTVSDKTYTSHGLTITMSDGFTEKELVNATVYYLSNDAIFTGLKENFTDLETIGINSESTEDDYASAVLENNKADYELQKEDSLRYFTYEKEVSGKNYFYLSAVAKSNDSFWLLTFASDVKDRDKYEPLFKTWAKSVKFE